MSRFDDSADNWDGNPAQYLWDAWQRRAMTSKASIKRWQMIEDALRALPEPKLCEDYLFDHGQVCAVGAFVVYREAQGAGKSVADVLAEWGEDYSTIGESEWDTIEAGEGVGLPRTIAWALAEFNDELLAGVEPEERYQEVLAWVVGKKTRAIELNNRSWVSS